MVKHLWLAGFALLSVGLNAQVGINAGDSPKGSLDVHYTSDWATTRPQTVSFPNVSTAQRDAWDSDELAVGMMIFNTDKQCLEMYFGVKNGKAQWSCIPDTNSKQAQKLAVSAAGFEGSYVGGVALTDNNKVKFKLENNSFSAISNVNFSDAVRIESTGKSGGTAISVKPNQNQSVNLQAGTSTVLEYKLSGTPSEGKLTAYFDKFGMQADQAVAVGLGSATVSNKENYTVSLTYNSTQIQGLINNTSHKVTIKIPYTNGKGSYNAVTNTQTSAPGQGGDTNDLTLDIPAGTFGTNGEITATISVGGDGVYKVKQMAPGKSYAIATFPIDMNGTHYNVVLKGIGGVPDRCFGKTTRQCVGYGADVLEHQFVYIPIQGPDGKTWLNNNLGADYANVNSPVFNPVQQAKTVDDYHAYGSFFQWQRKPDGHELMNWSSGSSAPTPKYSGTASRVNSWIANTNKFIPTTTSTSAWNYNASDGPFKLWQKDGTNNPCPVGYHVPTKSEWEALDRAVRSDPASYYTVKYLHSSLRVPPAGIRYWYDTFNLQSSDGYYWSSDVYDSYGSRAWYLYFNSGISFPSSYSDQADGFSVRCLKD